MSASEQRKKNRKRLIEKTRAEKLKKLREGNKITTRKKVDGKIVKKDSYYGGNLLHNIPKEGQRNLVLKMKGHGLGSDYQKTEEKAFKKAEDWQKSDEKKKITEERKNKGNKDLKINKDKNKKKKNKATSGWIRTSKGTLARRGTVGAKRAERKEAARKRAQEAAKKRKEEKNK